jgi:hypothetical protein
VAFRSKRVALCASRDSRRGAGRAIASASSRQRRRASFLRSRAHVVPMHRMQRLRPSGTSAGRGMKLRSEGALTSGGRLRFGRLGRGHEVVDALRGSPSQGTAFQLDAAISPLDRVEDARRTRGVAWLWNDPRCRAGPLRCDGLDYCK